MATFAELLNDVYTLTNRSDLVAETTLAVKAATLKIHQLDYYSKDLFETGISFPTAEYQQLLEYRSIIPRYRALKYIRKTDIYGTPGKFITILTPGELIDSYGIDKENVAYVAGEGIQIRSSTELQYIILGCYLNPSVDPDNFISWIAKEHPYAIVFEAARVIFKAHGFDEEAQQMNNLFLEQLEALKTQLTSVGS